MLSLYARGRLEVCCLVGRIHAYILYISFYVHMAYAHTYILWYNVKESMNWAEYIKRFPI